MSKTKLALDIVNDLRNLADSIECLVDVLKINLPETDEPIAKEKSKEALLKTSPPKPKIPTLEEVRAKLAALSQEGKQVQVKDLITGFGAKKLSDIPSGKYMELLERAEGL